MNVLLSFRGLQFRGEYFSPFPRVARSIALFCPYCFSVWASFTETDELGRLEPMHFAESVPCASHPAWFEWQVPGSLIERESKFGPSFDIDMLEALPEELLQRELKLHLNHWEKQQCFLDSALPLVSSASPPVSSSATGSAGVKAGLTAFRLPSTVPRS